MTATNAKIAAHLLLFLVALIVFHVGLGLGLQVSPALGTLVWVVAGAIVALNLLWMRRARR